MQMDLLIYHITLFFKPNENTQLKSTVIYKVLNFFASRSSLRRHMTPKHQNALTTYSIKCKEGGCTHTCRYISNLRDHLKARRDVAMEMETMKFNSMLGRYTIIHLQIRIRNIPSGDQN